MRSRLFPFAIVFLMLMVQAYHTVAISILSRHDFHSSISEVNFNESSKSFEISLRVFTDDLELALSRQNHKEVKIDKSNKHHSLIIAYLKEHFFLSNAKAQKYEMVFVGKELESDVTWLYFEIPVKNLRNMTLQNSILTEIYDDQTNLVNLTVKKYKKTFVFRRGEVAGTFSLS